ncbi:MAG TPA: DEAD/DEAH box helicase [Methanoregulaceae archaeon]|nr:DEAD/DEAH box helicase [Methanoregulaceae archaeon]HOP67570.1 DEAD/DEAH box helicase [Methanoregulaceae archaeon]HPJ73764.1 DEAD/DEAH box helicase [Methanoregulaceae archaeon]HPQ76572.1 DEAD/DEAH box helicase [Methanoregulaceae archaeon]
MSCITHPLILPDSLESREYQLSIALKALEGHTMVVLPTGLGKTAVALLVAASRLHNDGGKILMLAPTKPLVEQHLRFFRQFLVFPGTKGDEGQLVMFTGETAPEQRAAEWRDGKAVFATPQVIKNDLIAGSYTLEDVTLLIVDECHRAVGNYAYAFIAKRYLASAKNPLVLAMTASPGGKVEKVDEVIENLGIQVVETRSEHDNDVIPYIHEREIEVIDLRLPEELSRAVDDLNRLLDSRLKMLSNLGFSPPTRSQLSMKSLNALNAQIQARIQDRDPAAYKAASVYAECMKLRHAVSLAESQGSRTLTTYITRLFSEGKAGGASKASERLARDPLFIKLFERCMSWREEIHPKMDVMYDVVRDQLEQFPESRIIIFATFRDTVQQIVETLGKKGIECQRFVGQAARDAEKGLSQKKQIEALERFRRGEFKVLAATSVGEEGLDVPSTDLVVFYEAVPSEIRSIQRKGRTGRSGSGKIVVLVTKGTSDETYRFVSQSREKAMQSGIRRLAGSPSRDFSRASAVQAEGGQALIGSFCEGPAIVVDDRETSSKVVEILSETGASITLRRLAFGDYAIGDRILIERKTARDFVDTLVERDLLGQVRDLAAHALRPVLVIEGGDLAGQRDIHPNAIRGVLAAITVDLGVSILFTRDEEDTAQMILVLARREESEGGERKVPLRKDSRSVGHQQENIIASFPDIGLKNARLLLEHFGSVRGVIDADFSELVKVKGIGEGRARRIFDLAGKKYG